MGSRSPEFVGDEDISSGCGTDEGRVGYGKDRDGDGLNWWEDIVANVILGTEPNVPLAYVPGLQLRHPIISMLGGYGCQLEIEREYIYPVFKVVLILKPPFLLVMPFYLSFLLVILGFPKYVLSFHDIISSYWRFW